jgi:hypothetical protein
MLLIVDMLIKLAYHCSNCLLFKEIWIGIVRDVPVLVAMYENINWLQNHLRCKMSDI